MPTDLHLRLMALAHELRDDDPEAMAWIMRHIRQDRARVTKRRARKVRLAGHGRAGEFYVDAEALQDAD